MNKNKEPVQSDEVREAYDYLRAVIEGYNLNGFHDRALKMLEKLRAAEQRVAPQTGVEKLISALHVALDSHFNLYKMAFGEQSDPDADIVRHQMKAAITAHSKGVK